MIARDSNGTEVEVSRPGIVAEYMGDVSGAVTGHLAVVDVYACPNRGGEWTSVAFATGHGLPEELGVPAWVGPITDA